MGQGSQEFYKEGNKVRSLDHRRAPKVLSNHYATQKLYEKGGIRDSLAPIHRKVIRSGIIYFRELKEEALAASKVRWDASSSEVKSREPFGYRNFFPSTFRMERYSRLLEEEGPAWIGCRAQKK